MAKYNENYFKLDNNEVPSEFDINSLLGENETKLWYGKPKKSAFILASVFKMLPIALLWLCFDGFAIAMIAINIKDIPIPVIIFLCFFFLLHLLPVWIWLYNIITASKRHKNLEYLFTDKRIIIKTGVVGLDIENIYYADIEGVNVKVGLVDKILKVGDIYIKSAEKAQVLWDIENPYGITNKLQKMILDLKSDMHYPNALRPKENRGYNTSYVSQNYESQNNDGQIYSDTNYNDGKYNDNDNRF